MKTFNDYLEAAKVAKETQLALSKWAKELVSIITKHNAKHYNELEKKPEAIVKSAIKRSKTPDDPREVAKKLMKGNWGVECENAMNAVIEARIEIAKKYKIKYDPDLDDDQEII